MHADEIGEFIISLGCIRGDKSGLIISHHEILSLIGLCISIIV
jgi:hypothetical protein